MDHNENENVEAELNLPKNVLLLSDVPVPARFVTAAGVSIDISAKACLRPNDTTVHCLIVGRQASIADLRIQHKSISRKHAVLYYSDKDNNAKQQQSLFLQDLGGKHGTTVNGTRIARDPIELHVGDTIMFGNVRESIFTMQWDKELQEQEANYKESEEAQPTKENSSEATEIQQEQQQQQQQQQQQKQEQHKDRQVLEIAGAGLSGREKRQAEIAAMMASLDETPTYETYQQPEAQQSQQSSSQQIDNNKKDSKLTRKIQKHKLPVSDQFWIPTESERKNVITCIAMDASGARFATGSTDTYCRIYDFGTMDVSNRSAVRSCIPHDGHVVVSASFNKTTDPKILVGTGSVQPVVLHRDSAETIVQFMRGDMYVTDPTKTVGHTAAVTAVDWHPLESHLVLTSSLDGSARIWNVVSGKLQFQMLTCDKVFGVKNSKGQKTAVTTATFHPGGREFAVGTACGSIQIWNHSKKSARPERAVYDTGGKGNAITQLQFNADGSRIASRSNGSNDDNDNDCIKVWNAQGMTSRSSPIITCRDAKSAFGEYANCDFSHNGKYLVATSSERRKQGEQRIEYGAILIYDISSAASLETQHEDQRDVFPLLSIPMETTAPIVVKWHAKINQILVGCSDGQLVVLYDNKYSNKGVLGPLKKGGRQVDALSELLQSRADPAALTMGEIITPIYRDQQIGVVKKRKRDAWKDPERIAQPERPATGKHKAGAGGGAASTFQQFIADQTVVKTKAIAGKDPREALFKYNEGKSFIDKAYEGNAPEKQLAGKTVEEEEDEALKKK